MAAAHEEGGRRRVHLPVRSFARFFVWQYLCVCFCVAIFVRLFLCGNICVCFCVAIFVFVFVWQYLCVCFVCSKNTTLDGSPDKMSDAEAENTVQGTLPAGPPEKIPARGELLYLTRALLLVRTLGVLSTMNFTTSKN